jgi:hypothetical protein
MALTVQRKALGAQQTYPQPVECLPNLETEPRKSPLTVIRPQVLEVENNLLLEEAFVVFARKS